MILRGLRGGSDKRQLSTLAQAGSVGLHMASGIAVGTIFGFFLDKWFGTHPWCTGIFLIIGIVAGFKNVYTDTKRLLQAQKQSDKASGKPSDAPRSDDETDGTV